MKGPDTTNSAAAQSPPVVAPQSPPVAATGSSLPLRFPEDEGKHDDQAIEWWYLNTQFSDAGGKSYSFMLAAFKDGHHLGAFFDKSAGTFISMDYWEEGSAALNRLSLASASLRWEQTETPLQYNFNFTNKEVGLDVKLTSNKKPFLPGGQGLIFMGQNGKSYYYSLTDLTLGGTLQLGGERKPIHGKAWMDHQWGTWDWDNDFSKWKWYAIQLDDGTDLMLFNLYKGDAPIRSYGGYIDKDNHQQHNLDCRLSTRQYYTNPGGKWQKEVEIEVPALAGTRLILTSERDEQFIQPVVWEGCMRVKGSFQGKEVKGAAYQELNRPD